MSLFIQNVSVEFSSGVESRTFVQLANSVDVKRKCFDEQDDSTITYAGQHKTQKLENRSDINEQDRDASRRCVDLIVLGISYQSVEADVRKCFEIFGELELCEVNIFDESVFLLFHKIFS